VKRCLKKKTKKKKKTFFFLSVFISSLSILSSSYSLRDALTHVLLTHCELFECPETGEHYEVSLRESVGVDHERRF
jgi:hypothetical protein